jgi:hypothetical protein
VPPSWHTLNSCAEAEAAAAALNANTASMLNMINLIRAILLPISLLVITNAALGAHRKSHSGTGPAAKWLDGWFPPRMTSHAA